MQSFYSNGKLLITGEYLVLDGALALAIPTQYGQSLEVEKLEKNVIKWESIDHLGKVWFSHRFERHNGKIKSVIEDPVSERLIQIFKAINNLNPKVLKRSHGFKFQTKTNFPNNWGLGSSSTLINNLAVWANIDPYKLLRKTFGGSGYDIACAQHNSPITYQLRDNRLVKKVNFDPEFKDHLFFVHLNKKQNSRDAIKTYRNEKDNLSSCISEINQITSDLITSHNLKDFEYLLNKHENILSKVLKTPTIKKQYFEDYHGSIKSLGAWGGDFVIATGISSSKQYFIDKGYNTIVDYTNMALPKK